MASYYPNSMEVSGTGERVAVIMRTLDRPFLLRRGIESVLAQTHKDWHMYLVNDGGDKAVLEGVLSEYSENLAGRLTVLHHEINQGRWVAANSGLKAAEGDFVIIHDDDDIWDTQFLEKTVAFLNNADNKSYVAVATNSEIVEEEAQGDMFEAQGDMFIEKSRCPWPRFNKNIALADMLWDNVIPPIALLIRKAVADGVGLFNADLPVSGDWEYNIRLLQKGDIGTIDEVLAFYYLRIKQTGVYGNSINPSTGLHLKYNNLYTNALIRETLNAYPQFLGLLRLIALKNDKIERLKENLAHLHIHKIQVDILQQNRQFYEKLSKEIKYVGFFGKMRREWKRLKRKLCHHSHNDN